MPASAPALSPARRGHNQPTHYRELVHYRVRYIVAGPLSLQTNVSDILAATVEACRNSPLFPPGFKQFPSLNPPYRAMCVEVDPDLTHHVAIFGEYNHYVGLVSINPSGNDAVYANALIRLRH